MLSVRQLGPWFLGGSPALPRKVLTIVRDEYRQFFDCAVVSTLRVIWRAERFHSVSVTLAMRDHTFERILGHLDSCTCGTIHTRSNNTWHQEKKGKNQGDGEDACSTHGTARK